MARNKQKEIQYLKYRYHYYVIGESIVLDSTYDKLENELKQIGSPVVDLVDFPSEKEIEQLGFKISDIFDSIERSDIKYNHLTAMLSLEKIQVTDEEKFPKNSITNFISRANAQNGLECSLKYDGNSQELVYRKCKLDLALTRGDGKKGLNKAEKLKYIVPQHINVDENLTYQIRGELVIDVDVWDKKYNNPEPGKVSNPRNFIAGLINRDELNLNALNDLVYVAYDLTIINEETGEISYIDNTLEYLKKLGFNSKYEPETIFIRTYEDFVDMYYKMKNKKEESKYLIDGIVIKYPEKIRLKMGQTSHHPKWAVAIKFPSQEAETIITDVIWTIGKNREFTPIAVLEPVELLGTMVSRATLSNIGTMIKKGLFPGTRVSLLKSGEIIPKIVDVLELSPEHDLYMEQFQNILNSMKTKNL